MVSVRSSPAPPPQWFSAKDNGYERCRDERIRENLERMRKLGIADLALELKSHHLLPSTPRRRAFPRKTPKSTPRRSSRLQTSTPVSYVEVGFHKEQEKKRRGRRVEVVCQDEAYTEEHDKLLGSYQTAWTLFVDGRGPDGKRVYDQINGKTCHQCRQKTLGHHTQCSRCETLQGQFCGDCLFMRYGENVLEVNKNSDWICPVCRGICNCSICRVKKGWPPTGPLYRRCCSLGYKSVAHYLIQTRRLETNVEKPRSADPSSAKKSLPFNDNEDHFEPSSSLTLEHKVESTVDNNNLLNGSKTENSDESASDVILQAEGEKSSMSESVAAVAMSATSEFMVESVATNAYENSNSGCSTGTDQSGENRQGGEVENCKTSLDCVAGGNLGCNERNKEKQMLMSDKNKIKNGNRSSAPTPSQDCIAHRLRSKGILKGQMLMLDYDKKRKVKDFSWGCTPNSDGRLRKRVFKP